MARLVDVYPYQQSDRGHRFLVLKRADDQMYAGQWRMVGGKVEEGEKIWEAGLRELKEETGVAPDLYWTVPSVNHFYNKNRDTVELIPAFAAQVSEGAAISLNKEHIEYKWIEFEEVVNFILWPEQQRLIEIIDTVLHKHQPLENWIISF